jgi:hypothetical protein
MSAIEGGTMADFVNQNIISALEFVPKGTKKSIDQILAEMEKITDGKKKFYQLEAERMVIQRFLYHDLDKQTYVFSKDNQGKYFFKPATRFDRIMNCVLNFLPS